MEATHIIRTRRAIALPVLVVVVVVFASGCATKGFVRQEIDLLRSEVGQVRGTATAANNSAQEAMARAEAAEGIAGEARDLALGKMGYREAGQSAVTFAFDSDELTPESESALETTVQQILQRPEVVVDIYGYADPTGSRRYNLELGERRAEAVLRYLADRVPGQLHRFASVSYGASHADRFSHMERSAQRRVVVSLIERVPPSETEGGSDDPDSRRISQVVWAE